MKLATISIDAEVYDGLVKAVGRQHVSRFVEDLLRPHMADEESLEAAYREMAADDRRETEALEWSEGLIGSALHAPR